MQHIDKLFIKYNKLINRFSDKVKKYIDDSGEVQNNKFSFKYWIYKNPMTLEHSIDIKFKLNDQEYHIKENIDSTEIMLNKDEALELAKKAIGQRISELIFSWISKEEIKNV